MKVILFGASGMVGQGVLQECLKAEDVTEIVAILRSPLTTPHPKVREIIIKDLNQADFSSLQGFDGCFYTLGMSSSDGTAEQYHHTMYELSLLIAKKLQPHNPNMTFVFTSGQGANAFGKGWAKTLGEAENALNQVGFRQFIAFRPAVIQPLDGITSKTRSYRLFYRFTSPILQLLRQIFPNHILTTRIIGQAMLNSVRFGYEDFIAKPKDIKALADKSLREN